MSGRAIVFKGSLLAIVFLTPACSHGEDLLEVYHRARLADPVLSAADASRRGVVEEVVQARAPLLPQMSAGLDMTDSRASDPSGSVDSGGSLRSRNLTANVSQVVFDVSKWARLDAARARANAQDASYRLAEQDLLIRVATAYFNVLLATDNLSTVQANESAYLQQVDQADQRFRNGLSAQVDVEQARAYSAAARTNTIAARKAVDDARDALAEITGVAPSTFMMLRESLPMTPPSPDNPQAWVDMALQSNPALRAQQLTIAAADSSVEAARAGHLPTVSAGVTVGRSATWPTTVGVGSDGRTITVGLTLSVPLFSGGAISSQVRQAAAVRDGARDSLELQRRQVARSTLERYRSVIAGIEQTLASRESVESAQKALDSTRVGLGLGTQTMTDLLLAIGSLTTAQSYYSQARHQYVLGRLLLLQSAGTLSESDLVTINMLLR